MHSRWVRVDNVIVGETTRRNPIKVVVWNARRQGPFRACFQVNVVDHDPRQSTDWEQMMSVRKTVHSVTGAQVN
jgi:hypothetical protein